MIPRFWPTGNRLEIVGRAQSHLREGKSAFRLKRQPAEAGALPNGLVGCASLVVSEARLPSNEPNARRDYGSQGY
jgi:hypothetical protein